jgi:hypothetical protein
MPGGRSSVKVQPKQIVLAFGALFIGLTVWNNPSDTGSSTGDFIGNTVSWVQDAFGKVSEFSENVVE